MKKTLDISYLTVFSLYCALIPFTDLGEAIPNIILVILLVLFPFVVKKEDWKRCMSKTFYILFLLVFFIIAQSAILSRWEDYKLISKLVLLLIIWLSSAPIKDKLPPMLSFIFGALILLVISSWNLISYYLLSGKLDMTTGDQVATLLLGDRPYIGYVYVVSFCLTLYISTLFSKTQRLCYAFALLFFFFLLIISARVSLISITIAVFSYFFYTKNTKRFTFIVIMLSFFGFVMFALNPSLKKRFFVSSNNYKLEQLMKFEPRYYIWSCVFDIFFQSENYMLGQGFKSANKQLERCYSGRSDFADKNQQDFFVRRKFNTHSQPLNFLLSYGIVSLLLFTLFFIFWFEKCSKNYYSFILVIAILLFCLVENVLNRQMGVELFALTLIFSNKILN